MSDAEPHPLIKERQEGIRSSLCGCFYCLASFPGTEIKRWTDDGKTAICPKCLIDSVLSVNEHDDISPEALKKRQKQSFGNM